MIVTFIADKYRVGSNIGLGYYRENGLMEKINSVIDFENSKYPEKWVEKEKTYAMEKVTSDEFFEGKEHKLYPGIQFVYDGQLYAIDSEDRLITVISETGDSTERFVKQILETEIMFNKESTVSNVKINEIKDTAISKPLSLRKVYRIPYYTLKLIKENSKNFKDEKKICVEFEDEISLLPVTLDIYTGTGSVYYNSEEIFEDQIKELVFDLLKWFWKEDKYETNTDNG